VDPPLIVIIGGGSGIGLEVARQVRTHGARLILVGRDHATFAAAAEEVGKSVTTLFALDAHDELALDRFFVEVDAFDHLVSMVGDSIGRLPDDHARDDAPRAALQVLDQLDDRPIRGLEGARRRQPDVHRRHGWACG
jgi:NADP-dependent 3-hydroxy acid dehydrogenase YdfG